MPTMLFVILSSICTIAAIIFVMYKFTEWDEAEEARLETESKKEPKKPKWAIILDKAAYKIAAGVVELLDIFGLGITIGIVFLGIEGIAGLTFVFMPLILNWSYNQLILAQELLMVFTK